jgi:hypothetical protein
MTTTVTELHFLQIVICLALSIKNLQLEQTAIY